MKETIKETHFSFPNQKAFYRGKVRDVYTLEDGTLIMIATDRISAFDVILPRTIPGKGQMLNQISAQFLQACADIVPIWWKKMPTPQVSIGKACSPIKVEMVVRAYLAGHAARIYHQGIRTLCGVSLPDGLKENDRLPNPIITPTTKADFGHDEDISREDILSRGLVSEDIYARMENAALELFKRGTDIAKEKGLILVDTKYEFGLSDGELMLMDEIHTPDSSRYFYLDSYEELQSKGLPQRQLSKEFVREWLILNGFQGKEGQQIPEMTDEVVEMISLRYQELFQQIMGRSFEWESCNSDEVYRSIVQSLSETR